MELKNKKTKNANLRSFLIKKRKKHELSGQSGGRNGSGKKRINVSEGRIKSC